MNFNDRISKLKVKNLRTEDLYAYSRLHIWVNKKLGKASVCTNDPSHKSKRYHWANISGNYKRNLSDWRQLCASCNIKESITDNTREIQRLKALNNKYAAKPIICVDTGDRYESAREASEALGILTTSLNNCLKGHSRSAGGRKWQYEGGVF